LLLAIHGVAVREEFIEADLTDEHAGDRREARAGALPTNDVFIVEGSQLRPRLRAMQGLVASQPEETTMTETIQTQLDALRELRLSTSRLASPRSSTERHAARTRPSCFAASARRSRPRRLPRTTPARRRPRSGSQRPSQSPT